MRQGVYDCLLALTIVFSVLNPVLAKEPLVLISGNLYQHRDVDPQEKHLLALFSQALSGEFAVETLWLNQQMRMSMIRRFDNYCSYNAIRTAEREQHSYFSRYPSTIYPSRKLVSLKGRFDGLPERVSVSALLEQKFTMAIVGMSYYGELTPLLSARPEQIVQLSGSETYDQLISMFERDRFDMLIEYEDFVRRIVGQRDVLQFRQIAEYDNSPVAGFFFCSISESGRRAVDIIDDFFRSKAMLEGLRDFHTSRFSPGDQALIFRQFRELYGLDLQKGQTQH
ncbi:hypothetical protein GCM10009092_14710 [Bowmanella denitrificans]|uniref:Solute-binding protein family 3/N-terminal domain-containing protein n=1 Tax=Bowmanella denitrificans TaxID=366582 RepID=A0ABN0WZU7_9ALTE